METDSARTRIIRAFLQGLMPDEKKSALWSMQRKIALAKGIGDGDDVETSAVAFIASGIQPSEFESLGIDGQVAVLRDACMRLGLPIDDEWQPQRRTQSEVSKPEWQSTTGQLRFAGKVVRTYAARAKNVRAVLSAFQELDWPARIDDPLPGGSNPERLQDTCKSLRDGLSSIEFRPDGTGVGVCWAILPDL